MNGRSLGIVQDVREKFAQKLTHLEKGPGATRTRDHVLRRPTPPLWDAYRH
jgi:hypothetical protein